MKNQPPSFNVEQGAIGAEEWLLQIQKILDAMCITEDDHRVSLTSFCFAGHAECWQRHVKVTHVIATMT